ncbi:MAG TPA: glycoside hydrolase family 15 protein [Mycobacteriales bacterium]|nr:glycoside hydrolase family 15 protein [Mycobacteriales bacterium]
MSQRFAPRVLREYALLADGERGALIGPDGDIVWLCAPRWDSPSVFAALLGGRSAYAITPVATNVWGGYYEPGSLIWRSRWSTRTGVIESREALAFPGRPDRLVLLRRVRAFDTDARLRVVLDPRAAYDTEPMRELRHQDGEWSALLGSLRLRWVGAPPVTFDPENGLIGELFLHAGERVDLALELSSGHDAAEPLRPDELWRRTEQAWECDGSSGPISLAPRETDHHLAVLRGLTSGSGGMVAAATMSLPERSEAGRNYDYRYVWIRDLCYAGQALCAAERPAELSRLLGFLTARLHQDGDQLRPAYCTDGSAVPEPYELDLPGYPGGGNVAGNQVRTQFQLDNFGEALLLYAAAAGRLGTDDQAAADACARAVAERWTEKDAGVWELEGRLWTHSRLIAAAGLRAWARTHRTRADWATLADRIIADTARLGVHPDGHWQRSPEDPGLDGSLLLPPLRGGLPADDPRTRETLRAYLEDLTVDGFAYRFRHGDHELGEAEGAFLLCGFITALALHQQGRRTEAIAWWERTRAACGPPRLFSEEYDTTQYQMRGNLPQAFVHAFMVESAYRLAGAG